VAGVIRVLAQVPEMRECNSGASEHAFMHRIPLVGVPPSVHLSLRYPFFKRIRLASCMQLMAFSATTNYPSFWQVFQAIHKAPLSSVHFATALQGLLYYRLCGLAGLTHRRCPSLKFKKRPKDFPEYIQRSVDEVSEKRTLSNAFWGGDE
jgi:hypothetical protein